MPVLSNTRLVDDGPNRACIAQTSESYHQSCNMPVKFLGELLGCNTPASNPWMSRGIESARILPGSKFKFRGQKAFADVSGLPMAPGSAFLPKALPRITTFTPSRLASWQGLRCSSWTCRRS